MILTKEMILAQIEQYKQGRIRSQADFNAFNGAIDALEGLLKLEAQLESEQKPEESLPSPENKK